MPSRFEFIACYIMASARNGTLYVGSTNNLNRRAFEHATGAGTAYTARYGCKILVWLKPFELMTAANLRERTIKGWRRSWKLDLIEATNPDWRDLRQEIF